MFISSSIHIRPRRGIDDGKKLAHSGTSDSRSGRQGGEEGGGSEKGKKEKRARGNGGRF